MGSHAPGGVGLQAHGLSTSLPCPHAVHVPEGHGQDLHGVFVRILQPERYDWKQGKDLTVLDHLRPTA